MGSVKQAIGHLSSVPPPVVSRAQASDGPDRAAMDKVRAGSEPAFRELLERHWQALVAYALGFLGDVDTAEDTVQEAFLRLWEHRSAWQPIGSVRSYLYRIVRNLALQEREKRSVRERWSNFRQLDRSHGPSPDDVLEANTLCSALERAVDGLPARRREIFILARYHDFTYRQIAELIGISPQTVANQMSAALAELRRVLHEFRTSSG